MLKLLTIVGARPQFIKAAALSRVIGESTRSLVREVILHTGQHYDASMSEIFFQEMQIPKPAYNLEIGSESHGFQTGKMLQGIEEVIQKERPDGVVIYGDTNSTLAGALAASKLHIPVVHIEAGLRSFNKQMPEEINRIVADHVSALLFCPTLTAVENLTSEGILHAAKEPYSFDHQGVFHCGDLMYDNTLYFKEMAAKKSDIRDHLKLSGKEFILATVHRPANTDNPAHLTGILEALYQVASEHHIPAILPLHPRTTKILQSMDPGSLPPLKDRSGPLRIIPPVSFLDMIHLEAGARLILTDSGGVQKEAWFMEKPVVVLREETEWVEIIQSGNGRLTGASKERITEASFHYLETPPVDFPPLFGDGHAADEILRVLTSVQWQ
ncbi:MAG: non-hydrolyzing UDP-N-acetylglucosamine 2-epimerase [Bacteroidales bacterium]